VGYHGYHFLFTQPYPTLSENCIYALAATRMRQAAPERLLQTFDHVSDGVYGCVQVGANGPDFYQC